ADHAPGSSGTALALRAGGGVAAVDLFKQLPDHDELYVRWYAKYEAGVPWHHSGVWVGGYNPISRFPSPHAGERPSGDDRFSISIEPVWGTGARLRGSTSTTTGRRCTRRWPHPRPPAPR